MLLSHGEYLKLLKAKQAVKSAVLDNGEIIPRPMRMSAFVPVNIPIIFGLLVAPPTYA